MSKIKNTTVLNINNKEVKIFLDSKEIEPDTLKQIKAMMTHESVNSVRVMPDCHPGNGCCIGFTFPLSDKIVPNYIGGDIGCGILTYNLGNFKHDKKEKKIDKLIRDLIPMGNGHQCVHEKPIATESDYKWLYGQSQQIAKNFSDNFPIDISSYIPEYSEKWFKSLCSKISGDYSFIQKELGTLGGGNHYIEINININNEENKYLTIHSGSRNLGTKVCMYHQNKTFDKFNWELYNKMIDETITSDMTKVIKKEKTEEIKSFVQSKVHPPYLQGSEAYEYYFDMIFAQVFAQLNRHIMCRTIVNNMLYGIKQYDESCIIESIHNMIDFKNMIVRKGAISARLDELCIVSLNMRDGILLCKGKGNPDWNNSGPHGLGRSVTRNKAKIKFKLDKFKKEMKDVYSTSVCKETLDESPMAYKDSEIIIESMEPSLSIIEQLKPIINIKAC